MTEFLMVCNQGFQGMYIQGIRMLSWLTSGTGNLIRMWLLAWIRKVIYLLGTTWKCHVDHLFPFPFYSFQAFEVVN